MPRTTCVATMIEGDHSTNALSQRVDANVNCRMIPGVAVEAVDDAIANVIADTNVKIAIKDPRSTVTPSPKLSVAVMGSIEAVAAELYPHVPVMPTMTTSAIDGVYVTATRAAPHAPQARHARGRCTGWGRLL